MSIRNGNGIADNGSTNSLDNFYSNLIHEYIDFAQKHDNVTAIVKYLSSDLYLSVLYSMIFIYNVSWIVILGLVTSDLANVFITINNTEYLFQLLEIALCVIYLVLFNTVIILRLNSQIKKFGSIVRRLNYVIG